MQQEEYILGIDIGTGSTKGVGLSLKGNVLASAQHHYLINQPQPGYSEQDPDLIWDAFVQCVKDVTSQLGYAPAAVSFSSAMHSLIAADDKGTHLYPMITWADTRAEKQATELRKSAQGEAIYRQTGTPIHPMTPLSKLLWMKEHDTDLFNKAAKFISIKEYLWYKLFNAFEIDYSLASATGLFDIVKLQWSEEACQLAGITIDKLSKPVDTNYTQKSLLPEAQKLLGVPGNTPFVIGASDGCCANLGSHVTGAGTAALTIGTSGAVRVTGDKPVYNYPAMTFNYLLNRNTYVSGGAVNNGGIAIDWLLKNFLNIGKPDDDDYKELFKSINAVPAGSEGLIFLPYLYGERAPIWDANSSGAYLNIQPQHSQQHFLRAGLEGVCFALNDVIESLEKASAKIEQISVSGGFISSPTWVQTLANITGKKLVVQQTEDASAMGAIYIAMQELFPDTQLPHLPDAQVIEPDTESHAVYVKMFPLFKKVYEDMKGSMQVLNGLAEHG
jgi:gluconokinase